MSLKDMMKTGLKMLRDQLPVTFRFSGDSFATDIDGYLTSAQETMILEFGGLRDGVDMLLYADPDDFASEPEIGQSVKIENSDARHYRIESIKKPPGEIFVRLALVSVNK